MVRMGRSLRMALQLQTQTEGDATIVRTTCCCARRRAAAIGRNSDPIDNAATRKTKLAA